MNGKIVWMVALASLFAVAGCKKKEEAKKETAKTEEPAPAEPGGGEAEPAADPAAAEARPEPKDAWEAYAYRSIDCTKEMLGAAWSPEAEQAAKDGAEAMLASMKDQGEKANEAAAKAMEACAEKSCDEFPMCFSTEFTNAMTALAAPAEPTGDQPPAAEGEPTGPCVAFVEKSMELFKAQGMEMDEASMGQMRSGWVTACETSAQALGENFNDDLVAKANEACADQQTVVDYQTCWVGKVAELATAAATQ